MLATPGPSEEKGLDPCAAGDSPDESSLHTRALTRDPKRPGCAARTPPYPGPGALLALRLGNAAGGGQSGRCCPARGGGGHLPGAPRGSRSPEPRARRPAPRPPADPARSPLRPAHLSLARPETRVVDEEAQQGRRELLLLGRPGRRCSHPGPAPASGASLCRSPDSRLQETALPPPSGRPGSGRRQPGRRNRSAATAHRSGLVPGQACPP